MQKKVHNKKHILIVDDEKQNAHLVTNFLGEKGYAVALVETPKEALFQILQKTPDVIVLDVYMHPFVAFEFCAKVRNHPRTRHIRVIYCTSQAIQKDDQIKGLNAGVDDYLVHPFEPSELLKRIQGLLERSENKPKKDLLTEIKSVVEKPAEKPAPPSPVSPPPPIEEEPLFEEDEEEQFDEQEPKEQKKPFHFFPRIWEVINTPRLVIRHLDETHDFFLSLLVVLGTPVIASLSQLLQSQNSFDNWISSISIGLVYSVVVWIAGAILLHLIVPFYGVSIETKRALTLTGLAAVPRLVGAFMSALYSFLVAAGLAAGKGEFSAGIDLIPGLPAVDWIGFLSRISLFDVWSTALILLILWDICPMGKKRWNIITILVGMVSLIFGAFSRF